LSGPVLAPPTPIAMQVQKAHVGESPTGIGWHCLESGAAGRQRLAYNQIAGCDPISARAMCWARRVSESGSRLGPSGERPFNLAGNGEHVKIKAP